MSVKILWFEIFDAKKIKVACARVKETGLTIVGGDNKQGKTSILDLLCFMLGGGYFRPSALQPKGSRALPKMKMTLTNGMIIERKGKNSTLHVTDPEGGTGQAAIDKFLSVFAIRLERFINASGTEKAKILLGVLGIGDKMQALDDAVQVAIDERKDVKKQADRLKKHADSMPFHDDAPDQMISMADLMEEQKLAEATAREIDDMKTAIQKADQDHEDMISSIAQDRETIAELLAQVKTLEEGIQGKMHQVEELNHTMECLAEDLASTEPPDLDAIRQKIVDQASINQKVQANLDRKKACEDAQKMLEQVYEHEAIVSKARQDRIDLLNQCKLPLQGLSINDGVLLYNGMEWDCMAGSERLIVSTAIVKELQPECGFVLLDGLEAMDLKTLEAYDQYLQKHDMQVIGTRVSQGPECSFIMEDGTLVQNPDKDGA